MRVCVRACMCVVCMSGKSFLHGPVSILRLPYLNSFYTPLHYTDSNGQSLRARTSSNTHVCCSAADDGQKWERRDCGRRRGEWIRVGTAL